MDANLVSPALGETASLLEAIVEADGGAGSAFSVRRNGELLFSSALGVRDSAGNSFTRNTLMPIFSGTKGLVAGVMAVLADRGFVDYADNLAKYWPPANVWQNPPLTVAICLSHRAGLPQIDPPTKVRDLWDGDLMLDRLAQTEQLFPAGTRMAYHWLTYGWFAQAVIMSAAKMSAGAAIRELITAPFGIDAYLGVPASEFERCGEVVRAVDYRTNVFAVPNGFMERVYGNPKLLDGEEMPWNDHELMQRELPGGGAWATTDGMSKFYDTLLGTQAAKPLLSAQGLDAAWLPRFEDIDAVTNRPIVMSMGFERDDSIGSYGPIAPAFGHTGAGGSIHGCWPEAGISFSYVPRVMRTDQEDQRGKSLLKSVAAALL